MKLLVTNEAGQTVTGGNIKVGYTFWTSKGGVIKVTDIKIEAKYDSWNEVSETYISTNWRKDTEQGSSCVSIQNFLQTINE